MEAITSQEERLLLADDPVVHEWDDGSCLAIAVEGLAAERRGLEQLGRWRKLIAIGSLLVLGTICPASALVFAAGPERLLTGLLVSGLVLRGRTCLLDEIHQERARQQERADQWTRDVLQRLEETGWLLEP